LLRVVSHEHRDEERQHENCTEQVEDDEVNRVSLCRKRLRLCENARDAHSGPHDIRPPFLRHNLEENEERIAKVVEVIVRVSSLPWSKNTPFEWRAGILIDAVMQVSDTRATIIARL
jgi:hypothetical protein